MQNCDVMLVISLQSIEQCLVGHLDDHLPPEALPHLCLLFDIDYKGTLLNYQFWRTAFIVGLLQAERRCEIIFSLFSLHVEWQLLLHLEQVPIRVHIIFIIIICQLQRSDLITLSSSLFVLIFAAKSFDGLCREESYAPERGQ